MALEEFESVLQAKSLEYPDNLNEAVTQVLNSISSDDGDEVLIALLRSEYLHRMLWTELIMDENVQASLIRSNGTSNGWWCDAIFIQNAILSEAFKIADLPEQDEVGGVLKMGDNYFGPERGWVISVEEFDIDYSMVVLAGGVWDNHDYAWPEDDFLTMKEILDHDLEYSSYSFSSGRFGPALVALDLATGQTLCGNWGFQTNEKSEKYVCDAFFELSNSGTRLCEATLNPDFQESLSWKALEESAKESLFFLLVAGSLADEEVTYGPDEPSLAKTSQHFLACVALCTATPDSIISKLEELDDELVNSALEARSS